MQTTFDFKKEREKKKAQLGKVEFAVRMIFETDRYFVSLEHGNALIREVWKKFGDYSAASILRVARKLRSTGEFDTELNQRDRENMECAYRDLFSPYKYG